MTAAEYYVLADLMYGDPHAVSRFQSRRRSGKNLFAGTGYFIWLGITQPLRALYYLVGPKAAPVEEPHNNDPLIPEVSSELLRMLMETASKHLRDDDVSQIADQKKVS